MSEELGAFGNHQAPLSIKSALRSASILFQSADIVLPQLDARLLLQAVLGIDHSVLISIQDRLLSKTEMLNYGKFIKRRQNREPVYRIIGQKEFWGLNLNITDAVLEPRADTECLIDAVLAYVDSRGSRNDQFRIADIGTGSGAIALALLSELTQATAVASDISDAALSVAQANTIINQFESRIFFLQGSYLEPLSGKFDLIVSNPPYIRSADVLNLEPEVRENDPAIALNGGVDGLDAYRCLLSESSNKLEPGGRVFYEIGCDQADEVSELANDNGWVNIKISKDFGGNDRVFAASR